MALFLVSLRYQLNALRLKKRKVPEDLQDEEVLFLTDILPTGYTAIEWSKMTGGETVAVFGCGPVGLVAQKVAWLKGAQRVIGVDPLPYRLQAAERVAVLRPGRPRPLKKKVTTSIHFPSPSDFPHRLEPAFREGGARRLSEPGRRG